jgi:hypothetical protein
MDNAIFNFFEGILKEFKNLDNMISKTNEWYKKNYKQESESIFIHNMTKAIRLIYQEMLLVKDYKMKFLEMLSKEMQ